MQMNNSSNSSNTSTTDTSVFDKLNEKNAQVLSDISKLQENEKQLYSSLEERGLTSEQKQQIISKINELSQMRMNMYNKIKDMHSSYQTNITATSNAIQQQYKAIDIIEKDLNESKKRFNHLEDKIFDNKRLIEINNYYADKYKAYSKIMKYVAIMLVPIIVCVFLYRSLSIPLPIILLLIFIIVLIGGYYISPLVIDTFYRDNMNWNQYDWYFNKSAAPTNKYTPISSNLSANINTSLGSLGTCIGEKCCGSNMTYDTTTYKCVNNSIDNSIDNTMST